MKKIFIFAMAAAMAFAMSSCKSGESAYKKAYEKAQASQAVVTETTPQTTAPVSVTPATTTTTDTQDYSNVSVRTEDVTLVSGAGLKAYSVIVGSFGKKDNATGLQAKLKSQGYDSQVVQSSQGMYRVAISTFDDKASAAQLRNKVAGEYNGAWLLYKK